MTCYFGCAHDIFPRFGTNTSNRIMNRVKIVRPQECGVVTCNPSIAFSWGHDPAYFGLLAVQEGLRVW